MVMDECPKNTNDYNKIKISMELSTEWAKRSKAEFGKNPHKALFGIVQGGLFNDLRNKSLNKLIEIGSNYLLTQKYAYLMQINSGGWFLFDTYNIIKSKKV